MFDKRIWVKLLFIRKKKIAGSSKYQCIPTCARYLKQKTNLLAASNHMLHQTDFKPPYCPYSFRPLRL